jgi:hypothetical protein
MCMSQFCQPIIEEPESEADMSDCDIEDYPFSVEEITHDSILELYTQESQGRREMHDDPNRCCRLNLSTTLSESEVVQEMDMADSETHAQDEAMVVDRGGERGNINVLTRAPVLFSDAPSREVVVLPPEAASIPVPKLKNIERLRTVHYV